MTVNPAVPLVVSVRGGKMRPHYGTAIGKPPLSAEGLRGLLEWSHAATLRQQIANGRLHGKKIGPLWWITPAELARYRRESLGQPGALSRAQRVSRAADKEPRP